MPVTPDLFPSWARRFPFPPRDSVCSPRPPLPLVSLKDLREGGNCQDGSSGSEEVMNVLVRVFVQSERFGASRPVGRFLVPLASSFPFLTWKGAEGPTSPRKDTSHLISSESCGVGPLSLSLSLVGSDPGRSAPRPHACPAAAPRVERKRRELPAPALGGPLVWEGCAGLGGGEERDRTARGPEKSPGLC